MRTSIRRWLALGAGVGFVLVACGDTAEEQKKLAGIAQGCTLNSDCNNPLVCAFQRCHEACVETRDCPQGQRCVAGEDGTNVCQLPDDVDCTTSSGCNGSQVCAVDRECRDACSGENDCIGDQVCATSGACAEPDEVDDDGDLPPSGGTGGMGGTTGTGGSSNGGTGNAGTGNGGTAGMSGEGGDTGEGGEDTGGTSGSSGNAGQGGTQPTGGSAGSGMGGMSAGRGGMAGNAGSNAAAGAGGASAGMGGLSGAGAGGTSGAGAGSGGAAGSAGNGGTSGTGGTAPSACIQQLYGDYALRTDGRLLYQTTTQQIPILDSATATPLTNITSVLTGLAHGCASRSDGSAWCWATTNNGNTQGQLGDGGNSVASLYRATRVRTSASTFLENVTSVANGASYSLNTSCAVSAGTVWCWGILNDITNNGATLYSSYAVQVTVDGVNPLTNVVAVAISYGHACALVRPSTTNEVWCWGDNAYGEAGNGLQTRVRYPTKVIGVTNPSQMVLSAESTMALEGNRVKCWGRNSFQECGTADTTSPVLAPTVVKVMGGTALEGATALGGSSSEGCVVRSDQSLWCWGNQFNGYAAPFLVSAAPVTGVTHIGTASTQARFMTNDGKYHLGSTVRDPNCNALE